MKLKICFGGKEKIRKIDKPLTRSSKKIKRQLTNIRNETVTITTDPIIIKGIIKDHYE